MCESIESITFECWARDLSLAQTQDYLYEQTGSYVDKNDIYTLYRKFESKMEKDIQGKIVCNDEIDDLWGSL